MITNLIFLCINRWFGLVGNWHNAPHANCSRSGLPKSPIFCEDPYTDQGKSFICFSLHFATSSDSLSCCCCPWWFYFLTHPLKMSSILLVVMHVDDKYQKIERVYCRILQGYVSPICHLWLKYHVIYVIFRKYPCQNANQAGRDRVSTWKVSPASF